MWPCGVPLVADMFPAIQHAETEGRTDEKAPCHIYSIGHIMHVQETAFLNTLLAYGVHTGLSLAILAHPLTVGRDLEQNVKALQI